MMNRSCYALATGLALAFAVANGQLDDASSLYGIHWYGAADDTSLSVNPTDAEDMAPGREMWVLEINHVDETSPAGASNVWDRPSFYNGFGSGGHNARVTGSGKGHSLVYRLHPNWGRNVPYNDGAGGNPDDPFTLQDYAAAAQSAAQAHINWCRVWQIGNEANLTIENNRWNGTDGYNVLWSPDPSLYAATYLEVRDAIHTVTPNMTPAEQICLMQPVSPGDAGNPSIRFMDGAEFLWRQIEAIPENDRGRIDGFAIHGYAEPGGANDGLDGFFDSIREQIMVIDQFGLHDRPVFITEFNKHMPDVGNTAIGARFAQKAFAAISDWNAGTGDAFPGVENHDIVSAMWFVFYNAGGGWGDFSLQVKKSATAGTNPDQNPWYGFQAAAANDYAAGSMSGGGEISSHGIWLNDTFDSLDTNPPLPDWKVETTGGGAALAAGDGTVRITGHGNGGGATLRSAGYVYGDFRMELEFEITDSAIATGSPIANEANFDVRIREGSQGYSLTFFTDASDVTRRNRVILRRTNTWTQIGSFNEEIGITGGDRFTVEIEATPTVINYTVFKNGSTAPVVSWAVNDNAQRVGWIRVGSYNLSEARVDRLTLGGPSWAGSSAAVATWEVY